MTINSAAIAGVRLEFDQPSYTVGEGDQFVALRILKDGATREDIQFGVMLSDDTAIGKWPSFLGKATEGDNVTSVVVTIVHCQ